MSATATARAVEVQESKSAEPNTTEVWKWFAACLFAIMMAMAGYMSRGGITRAEAVELVSGPTNPYIQDKPSLMQRLDNIVVLETQNKAANDNMQRQITHLCIKLGVDPDSPADTHHKDSH